MAFWAWLQPLEDKVLSEPLALVMCALFTSGIPGTLESAELLGPEQLAGRGTVPVDRLQWPQSTCHGHGHASGSINIFSQHISTSGTCCSLPTCEEKLRQQRLSGSAVTATHGVFSLGIT